MTKAQKQPPAKQQPQPPAPVPAGGSTWLTKLMGDKMRSVITAVLPDYCTADRFVGMAIAAGKLMARKDNIIMESLLVAVFDAAKFGFYLDEQLGHAYLVPFKLKNSKWRIVKLMPGYKGYIHLAKASAYQMIDIKPYLVYDNDEWNRWNDEKGNHFRHVPHKSGRHDDAAILGGYTFMWLRGEVNPRFHFTEIEKVERVERSAMRRGGYSWQDPETRPDMILKTFIRQTLKTMDLSRDLDRAIDADEKAEVGKLGRKLPEEMAEIIDADYVDVLEQAEGIDAQGSSSKPDVDMPQEDEGPPPPERSGVDTFDAGDAPSSAPAGGITDGAPDPWLLNCQQTAVEAGYTSVEDVNGALFAEFGIECLEKVPAKMQSVVLDHFQLKVEEGNAGRQG